MRLCVGCLFFFQAEDGIRDLVRSRGLGDVYKRQIEYREKAKKVRDIVHRYAVEQDQILIRAAAAYINTTLSLSLIHI